MEKESEQHNGFDKSNINENTWQDGNGGANPPIDGTPFFKKDNNYPIEKGTIPQLSPKDKNV